VAVVLFLLWIVAPTVVMGVGLIFAVDPSRRLIGVPMVVLAAVTAFFEVRWFEEACWDTGDPCQGSALEVGLLISGAACAVVALGLLAYWIIRASRRRHRAA
jgi:hypothetical protein